jgi:hypothetical protein
VQHAGSGVITSRANLAITFTFSSIVYSHGGRLDLNPHTAGLGTVVAPEGQRLNLAIADQWAVALRYACNHGSMLTMTADPSATV